MVPPLFCNKPVPSLGVGQEGSMRGGSPPVKTWGNPYALSWKPHTTWERAHCGAYNAATAASKEHRMNKPDRLTSAVAAAEFEVGGVIMRRPFRIRRLGHF